MPLERVASRTVRSSSRPRSQDREWESCSRCGGGTSTSPGGRSGCAPAITRVSWRRRSQGRSELCLRLPTWPPRWRGWAVGSIGSATTTWCSPARSVATWTPRRCGGATSWHSRTPGRAGCRRHARLAKPWRSGILEVFGDFSASMLTLHDGSSEARWLPRRQKAAALIERSVASQTLGAVDASCVYAPRSCRPPGLWLAPPGVARSVRLLPAFALPLGDLAFDFGLISLVVSCLSLQARLIAVDFRLLAVDFRPGAPQSFSGEL